MDILIGYINIIFYKSIIITGVGTISEYGGACFVIDIQLLSPNILPP